MCPCLTKVLGWLQWDCRWYIQELARCFWYKVGRTKPALGKLSFQTRAGPFSQTWPLESLICHDLPSFHFDLMFYDVLWLNHVWVWCGLIMLFFMPVSQKMGAASASEASWRPWLQHKLGRWASPRRAQLKWWWPSSRASQTSFPGGIKTGGVLWPVFFFSPTKQKRNSQTQFVSLCFGEQTWKIWKNKEKKRHMQLFNRPKNLFLQSTVWSNKQFKVRREALEQSNWTKIAWQL